MSEHNVRIEHDDITDSDKFSVDNVYSEEEARQVLELLIGDGKGWKHE